MGKKFHALINEVTEEAALMETMLMGGNHHLLLKNNSVNDQIQHFIMSHI